MNNRKLFVGNLSYSVREGQLRALFSRYGEVIKVDVVEKKGYGFVEMRTPEEAKRAREALDETEFEGRNLLIDGIRPPLKPKMNPTGYGGSSHGGAGPSRPGSRSGHTSDGYRGKHPRPQGGHRSSKPDSGQKRGSSRPPRRNTGGRSRR